VAESVVGEIVHCAARIGVLAVIREREFERQGGQRNVQATPGDEAD
jgi:hypothetical protein